MEYIVTLLTNEGRKILSKHDTLEEATKAGKSALMNTKRGDMISVISGKINDDGKIEGKYTLYQSWS